MSFTVAIVGRPNVGKSTLFNRLVGARAALVDDTPGVTRDRREGEGSIGDLCFRVFDTAGLDDADDATLEGRMRSQTESALSDADVALFLIDARAGVTPVDEYFARWLRQRGAQVVLVANKCEGRGAAAGLDEAWKLGFGEPLPVSAEHNEGMADLFTALLPFAPDEGIPEDAASEFEPETDDGPDPVLRLAIVGRPNVGKSTLANRLVGEDRLLTGPEAGITRDSIAVDWSWGGRALCLVDTAGLRRRARITGRLEKLSAADTLRAVRRAGVVMLVIDARDGLERQDLAIARTAIDEGRALVIAANKWDVTEKREAAIRAIGDRLTTSLPQVRGVPVVPLSALTGQNLDRLMKAVFAAEAAWNTRISTGPLNRWLAGVIERHPPPMVAGRANRLRYITQVSSRPPTFAVWASHPKELSDSYTAYLVRGLRERFGMPGTPIRIAPRKGQNPYAKEK